MSGVEQESITKAGDVALDELLLMSGDGEVFDFKPFFLDIVLREDMWSPTMFGEVTVTDAANIINRAPIRGGEILNIKLRTKTLDDTPNNVINKSFQIYAVENRILNNDRESFYTLKFTSIEGISDQAKSISQAYGHDDSTTTDLIALKIWEDHCQEFRRIDEKKDLSNLVIGDTPHSSRIQFTSNYWTPFQILQYLTKKSSGNKHKGADFVFFESNKNFYFTSIQNIIQTQKDGGLFEHYVYEQSGQDLKHRDTGDDFVGAGLPKAFSKIEEMTIPRTVDILAGQDSGYYASALTAYDMFTKESAEYFIDGRNNFADFVHTEEGTTIPMGIQRNPYSYLNVKYLNMLTSPGMQGGLSEGSKGAAANVNMAEAPLLRQNYFNSFTDNRFELIVPGRTDIEVGRMIKIAYPTTGDKAPDLTYDEIVDPVISGNFLITAIRHTVNQTDYKMILEVCKNGLAQGTGPEDDVVPVLGKGT